MKKYFLFLIAIAIIGCKSNSVQGIYVCDASKKKADTTIKHETYSEHTIDMTCVISELDFKGNSTVTIKLENGQITSSYIIDNGFVRIKGEKSDMLFRIVDKATLKAEGFPEGTYHKK